MNRYEVLFTSTAQKQLSKLELNIAQRIKHQVLSLSENPFPQGSIKLSGVDHTYRIHIGDYRVIYTVMQDKLIVLVLKIADRKDAYR